MVITFWRIVILYIIYTLCSYSMLYEGFKYSCVIEFLNKGIKSENISLTKWLYNKTKMNKIGSFVCATLLYILMPAIAISQLIKFVYFLFHVGRKDK